MAYGDILGEEEKKKDESLSKKAKRNIQITKFLKDLKEDYKFIKGKLSTDDKSEFGKTCKTIWEHKEEFISEHIDENIKKIEELIGV